MVKRKSWLGRPFLMLTPLYVCFGLIIGCDQLQDGLQTLTKKEDTGQDSVELPSYEKQLILQILENQEYLLLDLENAVSIGDRELILSIYNEILRLDQEYQREYEQYEKALTNKAILELSEKHAAIVRRIPSFNSLMGN